MRTLCHTEGKRNSKEILTRSDTVATFEILLFTRFYSHREVVLDHVLSSALTQSRVGGFLQRLANHVVGENGDKHGESWEDNQPP